MKFLILSDIHANWTALQAVLAAEKRYDGVFCLGDIVNYGPHPVPCVEWVQDHALHGWVVQGNHDRAVGLDENPRCSESYQAMAAAMQRYTAAQLSGPAKQYLASLPLTVSKAIDGANVVLCHAAPSDPLYAYVPMENFPQWSDETVFAKHPDYLFVGHTHTPFIRQFGDTIVANPGSVGQPKDGVPQASYITWTDGELEMRSAKFDVEAVVRDLAGCARDEITQQLAHILRTGGDLLPAKRR